MVGVHRRMAVLRIVPIGTHPKGMRWRRQAERPAWNEQTRMFANGRRSLLRLEWHWRCGENSIVLSSRGEHEENRSIC